MSEAQDLDYRISCAGTCLTWSRPQGVAISLTIPPKMFGVLKTAAPLPLSATIQASEEAFVMIVVDDEFEGHVRLSVQWDDALIQSGAMRRSDLVALLGGN